MAKRAGLIALGGTLVVVPVSLAFAADRDENALTPPAGELVMAGGSVVLLFAVTFAIVFAVQWWRRRAAVDHTRTNR